MVLNKEELEQLRRDCGAFIEDCQNEPKHTIDCEVCRMQFVKKETVKVVLQGLESMANNGIYQGKLTIEQIKLFFTEHYEV